MESVQRELGFAEMILRKGRPKKKKAPQLKKSEVEEKLHFEMEMRDAAQRLLSACSNPQQRLDAGKTILTSNSRTLALMTALQKEQVKEVEDAHGLTELKDADEISREELLDSVSSADVTISALTIPLKWCRIDHSKYKSDCWKYQLFCLVRSGIQVLDSKAYTKVDLLTETISIADTFVLKDLSPDFVIDFEFYYAEELPKPKKAKKGEQSDAAAPIFAIAATASLTLAHCNLWQQKQSLKCGSAGLPAHVSAPPCLPDLPPLPVLNFFRVEIDVKPHFTLKPAKEGFLDVQQMKGGMPHWIRCWCSLQGMYFKAWKGPEDQTTSDPINVIDINEHMMLDHVAKSSVQRPHTIHISYCKSPYADHFLSTDTKEERILWEIALHKSMINSSTWHPNKLSSTENLGTSPSPLKCPPPKPPRPVTGEPQFCYTPGAPCLPAYKAQYEAAQRSSRKDKILDWTPMKRSKSAERRPKTPAPPADDQIHRSRANTCKKPNRRRSRSADMTPRTAAARNYAARSNAPRDNAARDNAARDNASSDSARDTNRPITDTPKRNKAMATPKRDRVSDATYVSMCKFSKIAGDKVSADTNEEIPKKPNRPAPSRPHPPSLSKIPVAGSEGTPSKARRGITSQGIASRSATPAEKRVNQSYKAAISDDTPPQPNSSGLKESSSRASPRSSPRLKKLQVDLTNRSHKKKAPSPIKCASPHKKISKELSPLKSSSQLTGNRLKKSPAPVPQRRVRVPRQSSGGTNNLNSPNRSDLKNKDNIMNLYQDSESFDLSPSIKEANTPSSCTSTPASFDFDNIIDEAFGSIQAESTGLSVDTTPSFHPAARSGSITRTLSGASSLGSVSEPRSPSRGQPNTPGKARPKTPGSANRKVSRNTPLTSTMKEGAPDFGPLEDVPAIEGRGMRRRPATEKPNITPICEEEEEEERPGAEVIQEAKERRNVALTFEQIKQEFIPSPIRGFVSERGDSLMDGYFDSSLSTIEDTEKENDDPTEIYEKSASSNKRRSESPAPKDMTPLKRVATTTGTPAKKTSSNHLPKSPALEVASPNHLLQSPALEVAKTKSPRSLSPLNCLRGSATVSMRRKNSAEGSPGEPDLKASPITVRPKPKFQVVNGKLMPI